MLKMNNSYVKICESYCCLLNAFLPPFLAVFVSIVTYSVVFSNEWEKGARRLPLSMGIGMDGNLKRKMDFRPDQDKNPFLEDKSHN
jgi:hypothetical protein